MTARLNYDLRPAAEGSALALRGLLTRVVVGELHQILSRNLPKHGQVLFLNMDEVAAMDSSAVAALVRAQREAQAQGGRLTLGTISPDVERALAMFRVTPPEQAPHSVPGLFESTGQAAYHSRESLVAFLQLMADSIFAVVTAVWRPRRLRWRALTEQAVDIGSRALGIVALITFLVGLTVAFQSAHQLRQFGAAIFVADLTAVSMVREMGPLMTAILVAGRSGASIAAEVATMQVSEEVDALRVMGIDPIDFLAVPRLLAITITIPLLTVLANLVGMLGGFLVGVLYLDIAWNSFLMKMLDSLVAWDLISGLIKSVAFAFGIGLIGLFYGFKVRGGASEVGRTTTAAVVTSIFYIIVADCIFSVLFYVVL
ncbi:MAG: MlaE family lipid ABC transporter permease subunit [Myxococcota bacterium]|nr:MlaE family lipid ABC transporter permease subunit [Myxococcota bacterium]